MRKILFISHDASRTGAPILLLRLIAGLKKHGSYEITILLKRGGSMATEFFKYGKTFIWNESTTETCYDKLLRNTGLTRYTKAARKKKQILKQVADADIVFNNTVSNAELLHQLPLIGKKVFSYFHELDVVTELQASKTDVAYMDRISEMIFTPAQAVKSFFNSRYGIPDAKISLLKYIIPINEHKDDENSIFRTQKFLVGFSGTLHWRKGYDLVPLIAKQIVIDHRTEDIHFVWIGANRNFPEFTVLLSDIRKLNLEKYFTWVDPTEDISGYLKSLDLFVLPSREDAFPLVVLEAAVFEIPSVCFSGAGGIPEFVGDDAGMCVNYLDIDSMASAILKLKQDAEFRRTMGKKAREKLAPYADVRAITGELMKHFS